MKLGKNILWVGIVLVLSYFLSGFSSNLYDRLFYSGSSFVNLNFLVGFPLSYTFFLTLVFTAFGGKHKNWWIAILLIPAAIFEVYFDLAHLYFPIALGLAGWLLGLGIPKFFSKR